MAKGLAQERLALDAGVDRTVVSKIERAVTNPSLEILLRLANQLDVEVGQSLLPPSGQKSITCSAGKSNFRLRALLQLLMDVLWVLPNTVTVLF